MSEYQLTEADRAVIQAALERFAAKRAAYEASLTPEQLADLRAQHEANRQEIARWQALSPEEKELERIERKRQEEEFWESTKLSEDVPRFDEIMAPWVACNLACALVSRAFQKDGKLNRRTRKQIEHKIYTLLRKTIETKGIKKLKVRISFQKNNPSQGGLHGAINRVLGAYTAVLLVWDAEDARNYTLRAGLPASTQ
jgi:hypothetical protein